MHDNYRFDIIKLLDQEKRFLNNFFLGNPSNATSWGRVQDNHFYIKSVVNLFYSGSVQKSPIFGLFCIYGILSHMKHIRIHSFFFQMTVLLFVVIALIQVFAGMFDWYYIFPQLDVPMHVMGGMLVGFATLACVRESMNPMYKLFWVILITLVIGVGIEIIEWSTDSVFHLTFKNALQQGTLDTYSDLLHDWIGGMLAFCFAYFTRRI